MERKASLFRRRCRNPFVHYIYIIGNIGSLHPLPETAYAVLPGSELERLRVLRLRGRDRRFSFKWLGMYFEFENMNCLRGQCWIFVCSVKRIASTSCPKRCL